MTSPSDPYGNFNFRIEIDGLTIAGFAECSGLSTTIDVIEYREGGDLAVRKLPGLAKHGDITLKRGVTQSGELQAWIANVANGMPDRRDGAVVLQDGARTPVVRWNFFRAFPRKWEGPHLDARGDDIAMETLVLCCEGLKRA